MIARCSSVPISHLRLERRLQGDLAPLERFRVDQHLRRCEACRACFEELRREVVVLKPLPQPLLAPDARRSNHRWTSIGVALSAAAAFMLWMRSATETSPELPPARVAVKGGELALELVREPRGERARDAGRFAPGDRFEGVVSCPPGARRHWQVVILQAGQAYFPFTPSELLTCGNGITLPGAFALDGSDPARVCIALSDAPLSRERLARSELPEQSACVTLVPEPNVPR
jgi:hypothetical protein